MKQNMKWQADADASVMAAYQEIISDKARAARAVKAAKAKAADLSKRAAIMNGVSGYAKGGKLRKGGSK